MHELLHGGGVLIHIGIDMPHDFLFQYFFSGYQYARFLHIAEVAVNGRAKAAHGG